MKSIKNHDMTAVDERAIKRRARQIIKSATSKSSKISKEAAFAQARQEDAVRVNNYRRLRGW